MDPHPFDLCAPRIVLAQTTDDNDVAAEHTNEKVATSVETGGLDRLGRAHVVVPRARTGIRTCLLETEPMQFDNTIVIGRLVPPEVEAVATREHPNVQATAARSASTTSRSSSASSACRRSATPRLRPSAVAYEGMKDRNVATTV